MMYQTMLKSKLHRAVVTDANLHYEGSITIDRDLMEQAGILPFEQVHVVNISSADRIITYAIPGGAGEICLNGAAARLFQKGDQVIIMCYAQYNPEDARNLKPEIVLLDENNRRNI
jgi:aspartate 1-decarboxylase